jgi:hypothetical protein
MKIQMALVLSFLPVVACGGDGKAPERESAAETPCRGAAAPAMTKKDGAMPILGIHHAPSLTRERYEEVVRRLTNGRSRLESLSDGGIEGLLVHVAGEGADGFWIVDLWESQQAVERFGRMIRPIAESVGIEEPLKTYPIHTLLC